MSSIVQLKRSALSGKVPGTGSLNLGELALNTYDGKIFFRRSGSTDTIQEVVTTNVVNTGSVTITGTLTAESIVGSISASNGVVSGSSQIVGILSSLNSYTASYATTGSNQFTADQNITGSLRASGTGSFGSLKVNDTLTINHGETIMSGSALVTNDLTILGAVNARQFNISVISSSVLFESGSSRFGNTSDDTHDFTGSVNVTGSLYLNGVAVATGSSVGNAGVFDFNLDPAAGTIGFITDSGSNYIVNASSTSVNIIGGETPFVTITSQSFSTNTTFTASLQQGYTLVGDSSGTTYAVATSSFGGALPTGVISGSSQLTSSYDTRYVISGSITQTTWDNIASKPAGIISGSSQLTSSYDSRYALSGSVSNSSISSSIMEATKYIVDGTTTIFTIPGGYYTKMLQVFLNGSKLDESEYTETDSSNITITPPISSGSILEIINFKSTPLNSGLSRKIETYTSTEGQLVFNTIASASLGNVDVHINGFKLPPQDFVVTNSNTITLTTGSAAGELVEIGLYDAFFGTYLTSTDLTSLNTTTASLNTSVSNLNTATSSYETKGRGIVSGSSQITPLLPTGTVSGSIQVLGGTGIISSSTQLENATITNLTITNLTTVNETASVIFSSGSNRFGDFGDDTHDFTGSVKVSGSITTMGSSTATSFNGTINANNGVVSGSAQTILNLPTGTISGSSQVNVMSTTNITQLATTGSNTFTGNQTITGTINTISIPNDLFAFQFLLMGG
jgi:hypothetical protein